ncbi:MAG: sialidase family protein, partial [Limnochordia bacterium]|nr:sialidase family protein [Limnochordia bacterium]
MDGPTEAINGQKPGDLVGTLGEGYLKLGTARKEGGIMNGRVCKSKINTYFFIIIVLAVFLMDNPILGKSPGLARLLLTEDYVIMHRSPDPGNVYLYSPGIVRLDSGRLVGVCRQGGKGLVGDPGMIFTSDDGGETWVQKGTFPYIQARPFVAGGTLYIIGQGNHLGQSGDLKIICSLDEGDTWSKVSTLTSGQQWHASPCNVSAMLSSGEPINVGTVVIIVVHSIQLSCGLVQLERPMSSIHI